MTSRAIFLFGWILGLPGKRKFSYRKSGISQISAHILKEDTRNYRGIWFSKNSKKVDPEVGGALMVNMSWKFGIQRRINFGKEVVQASLISIP